VREHGGIWSGTTTCDSWNLLCRIDWDATARYAATPKKTGTVLPDSTSRVQPGQEVFQSCSFSQAPMRTHIAAITISNYGSLQAALGAPV
jgi:hypothetical protein